MPVSAARLPTTVGRSDWTAATRPSRTVIAGNGAHDPATATADQHKADYSTAAMQTSLKGRCFGVLKYALGNSPQTDIVFAHAVATLKRLGARDYRVG